MPTKVNAVRAALGEVEPVVPDHRLVAVGVVAVHQPLGAVALEGLDGAVIDRLVAQRERPAGGEHQDVVAVDQHMAGIEAVLDRQPPIGLAGAVDA